MKEVVNILIVDDLRENHLVMESVLEEDNINVVKALSGEEALDLCTKMSFAVILMDVQMPGLNGFQTAELLRMVEKTKHIPIIFVTAISKEEQSIFKGYEVGAVDYLFKPINPRILKSKVKVFIHLYIQKRQLEEMTIKLNNKIKELEEIIEERNQLENMCNEDFLTNIYNRRGLDRMLQLHWNNCRTYKLPISMIMLDIDNFKTYNDRYGHLQGDVVLSEISSVLRESLRRSRDFAGRYGGEEFLVVLPNTNIDGAKVIANRIRENLKKRRIKHEDNFEMGIITVSMGITETIPNEEVTIKETLERTDKMLYEAKDSGKNQYKF